MRQTNGSFAWPTGMISSEEDHYHITIHSLQDSLVITGPAQKSIISVSFTIKANTNLKYQDFNWFACRSLAWCSVWTNNGQSILFVSCNTTLLLPILCFTFASTCCTIDKIEVEAIFCSSKIKMSAQKSKLNFKIVFKAILRCDCQTFCVWILFLCNPSFMH